jgi:hypothetical protein
MSPEVAKPLGELVSKLTHMDERLWVTRKVTRLVWRLWVPVLSIAAMFTTLAIRTEGWECLWWSTLGCVSGYVLVSAGEELCKLGMQLLQRNLDECKTYTEQETEERE